MPEQTTKTIIVGADVQEAFAAWSDFESFPRFMKHVKSVTRTGDRTWHWVAEGPLGLTAEWDAEITMWEPDKRIGWRSSQGDTVKTSGQVTFNALGNGQTEITITLQYVAPGMAETVARLLADVGGMIDEDLRAFKAHVEGRVPAPAR